MSGATLPLLAWTCRLVLVKIVVAALVWWTCVWLDSRLEGCLLCNQNI